MLKVPYSHFKGVTGTNFMQAVHKLLAVATDGKTAYTLKKALTPFKAGMATVYADYQKDIIEKFGAKDEKGELIKDEHGACTLPEDGKDPKFDEALKEFETREVKNPRPLLTAQDIRDAKLTANEIETLEPLLDEASFDTKAKPGVTSMKLA